MLQTAVIKENRDWVIKALEKKKFRKATELIDEILRLDQERKETQQKMDQAQAEANQLSRQIGDWMKSGESAKADIEKEKVASLKLEVASMQQQLELVQKQLNEALLTVPNTPCEKVPLGNGPEDNQLMRSYSPEGKILFQPLLPHWDLIKQYDIIDFELGNKITGAGFPVYKGAGARLQRALINFFLDEALKAGYVEIQPPIFVNEASGLGTGQLPDKEGQMYHMTEDRLYAIPTAEVPITNLYRDEILSENQLPIRNVGYTPCFRREAGSWGAHVRGLNRLHQFDKVEIVQITKPENSYQTLEEMVNYVAGLMEKLELTFRVIKLCGGDMGFTSALTYDFEAYAPGQKLWLEVSSVSNFEAYQANRLKLRYRTADKKTILLHTLNGSALALPRIVAALLETNQQKDHILLPKVLHPYTGFETINLGK
jgi:seryl-tRNA synthetase